MNSRKQKLNISPTIFNLRSSLNSISLTGHHVNISKMKFSLSNIYHFFRSEEIFYILGFYPNDEKSLEKIENELWSLSLIIKSNKTDNFFGFFRVYMMHESKRIIGIHGGCLNSNLFEKICLIEAWYLLICECIYEFKCEEIRTTCMVGNKKAYEFINKTGFKEVDKANNLFYFVLDYNEFETLCKKFIKWYLENGKKF